MHIFILSDKFIVLVHEDRGSANCCHNGQVAKYSITVSTSWSQTEEERLRRNRTLLLTSQRVQLAYQSPLTVHVLEIDRAVGWTAYSGLARNSNLRHTFCSFGANFTLQQQHLMKMLKF